MGAGGVRRRDDGGGRIGAGLSVLLRCAPCVPSRLPAVRRQKSEVFLVVSREELLGQLPNPVF